MKSQTSRIVPGALLFAVLFVVGTLMLLSQLTEQTKFTASGLMVAQPRFWPAVAISGMAIFGIAHLISILRQMRSRQMGLRQMGANHIQAAGAILADWVLVLEFVVWFMGYVYLVPLLGYLISTLGFMALLTARMGYRHPRQMAIAMVTGLAIILLFKTGLAVKIPGGQIYEVLPDPIRAFMIVNF